MEREARLMKNASLKWVAGLIALGACCSMARAQEGVGDVVYVPTPEVVVEAMLKMAKVGANDFIIDLGSGDGRIVVTAAKKYGARASGSISIRFC